MTPAEIIEGKVGAIYAFPTSTKYPKTGKINQTNADTRPA